MTSSGTTTSSDQRVDRIVGWAGRHWLLFVNGAAAVYAGLPWLSPLAKCAGQPLLGELLFRLYTPLCHQLPERSFFFCGHQIAFCHRCVAMYTSIVAAGLLFGLLRRYIKPTSLKIALLLLLPMLIDGGSHLLDDVLGLGLRGGGDAIGSANFWLRMITGVLAGAAALVFAFPRLERDLGRMFATTSHNESLLTTET